MYVPRRFLETYEYITVHVHLLNEMGDFHPPHNFQVTRGGKDLVNLIDKEGHRLLDVPYQLIEHNFVSITAMEFDSNEHRDMPEQAEA